MSILRRIYRRIISKNPETGKTDRLNTADEYHKLCDEDGALDSTHLEEKTSHSCGCFGIEGGRCSESGCGVISCVRCHHHCGGTDNPLPQSCGKPLCRSHSHYLQIPDGRTIPFCRQCYGKIVRTQRWISIGRFLLAPFIEDTGGHDGR